MNKNLALLDSMNLFKNLNFAKIIVVEKEADLSKLSFPYFIKADIPEHKTEKKAVLKCANLEIAEQNFQKLKIAFPNSRIIIQEQTEGIEMILGLKKDKVFGKLLLAGFGGTFTEVVKDVSFRALPLDKKEIEAMLKELKLYPVLVTRKKYALDKFISLAEKISKIDAEEADFNPVIISEKDAVIVDARILI